MPTGLRFPIGKRLGYVTDWRLLNASDYGVSQLRPRFLFVAVATILKGIRWPDPDTGDQALWVRSCMTSSRHEVGVAPGLAEGCEQHRTTVVGGSLKHGGPISPDARETGLAQLGVDGIGIADYAPEPISLECRN